MYAQPKKEAGLTGTGVGGTECLTQRGSQQLSRRSPDRSERVRSQETRVKITMRDPDSPGSLASV